ncbi:hypothetical protein BDV95DRAFT_610982 [Massariosphaeria phaeospora]|uniref:Ecp2 effector protein-like domain-containing protein n=1 Tax=Massariosphaeria phaeospora TaxID=100035 RepID=A0A7C8MHC0_9PLEO|nr:hypothetical protein BDV95DRAFT_610982 [Massariosphaeria phaeospora]
MRFTAAAISFLLTAAVTAAPTPEWDPTGAPGESVCQDDTWGSLTGQELPSVDDCRYLAETLQRPEKGIAPWTTTRAQGYHTLGQHGTCKFVVKSAPGDDTIYFNMDRSDVNFLIYKSIGDFVVDGKVGGQGTTKCRGSVLIDKANPNLKADPTNYEFTGVTWEMKHT